MGHILFRGRNSKMIASIMGRNIMARYHASRRTCTSANSDFKIPDEIYCDHQQAPLQLVPLLFPGFYKRECTSNNKTNTVSR